MGHATVIADAKPGEHGAIRTGVTAVWPHGGWPWEEAVYAGVSVLNGHGELIGICQIEEWGLLRCPVLLTSSLSIGAVYDGAARWVAAQDPRQSRDNFMMPVVTEVSDEVLSDNRAFPISSEHVAEALESSSSERPAEGSVGAGTGTICYDLKGGIGTASRRVSGSWGEYTIGALVLTNFGERANLTIAGVEVGPLLDVAMPPTMNVGYSQPSTTPDTSDLGRQSQGSPPKVTVPRGRQEDGSCITVLATDAPCLPHQLKRMATRAGIGLTRSGSFVGQTSGEIGIAFSTATQLPLGRDGAIGVQALADGFNPAFNPLFEATVEMVHEAVLGSIFASDTMTGLDDITVPGLPVEAVAELLRKRGVIN